MLLALGRIKQGIKTFDSSAWAFRGGKRETVNASSKASVPAGTRVNTLQSSLLRARSKENNFNLLFMLFNVTLYSGWEPRGPLIQDCQPPGACCMPLWVHEPLLWFQSITHSLHQLYKCQGVPAAMPRAPVGSSSRSCSCQAYPCVGMIATYAAVSICP